jgi:hypothetical protein
LRSPGNSNQETPAQATELVSGIPTSEVPAKNLAISGGSLGQQFFLPWLRERGPEPARATTGNRLAVPFLPSSMIFNEATNSKIAGESTTRPIAGTHGGKIG